MDTQQLIEERGTTHGDYGETAKRYKEVNLALTGSRIVKMRPEFLLSLDMIALKMARIASGDPDFRDHWDDIAGYAKLAADRCSK